MRAADPSTSSRKSPGPPPASISHDSATSSALPTAAPSGESMAVSSQTVGRPARTPMSRMRTASSRAEARSGMNAPSPTFTSSRIASAPAASFLDITEAAIRPGAGTVPVTSLSA